MALTTRSNSETITAEWFNDIKTELEATTDTIGGNDAGDILTTDASQTAANKTLTDPVINTGVSGTAIDTDANLAADSDTLLASQKAVKAFVTAQVGGYNLDTAHVPTATDFPNSTNLYGWNIAGVGSYDGGDWIGSKALTENGAITSILSDAGVNDVLGNDTFCYFDGASDCLLSADAVFDNMNNNDFSVCGWFYRADWASAAAPEGLISKTAGGQGWNLALNVGGDIFFYNQTASAIEAITSIGALSPGWHHIAAVKDDGTSIAIYVDGKCAAYAADGGNIVDAGDFVIGSTSGASQWFEGGIQYVAVDTDTAWTANDVRKIYAAQSQTLVIQDNLTSKVSILDGRALTGVNNIFVTSTFTITATSLADATGYSILPWEDGLYRVNFQYSHNCYDSDGTTGQITSVIYAEGAIVDGTYIVSSRYAGLGGAVGGAAIMPTSNETIMYLTKDTIVKLQAFANAAADNNLYYSSGVTTPKITLTKLD